MKTGERQYFKNMGNDYIQADLRKPFSYREVTAPLLHDIAAIFSLLPNRHSQLKIIDLGCGTGWTSSFYALSGYDVTGVDIAKDAVDAANKYFSDLKSLKFICKDYDNLPFKDEFDIAIFFDSLHHSENELESLEAAYRTLKKGGTMILCEPGKGHSKTPESKYAVETFGVNEKDMPPKLSRKLLKEAGFTDIKTYAYPAMIHRALYREGGGRLTKILRSNSFTRGLTVAILASVAKPWHGIVTAKK